MRVVTMSDLDNAVSVLIDIVKGVRGVQDVRADVTTDKSTSVHFVTITLWCTVDEGVLLQAVTSAARRDVQIAVRLFALPAGVRSSVEVLLRPAGEIGDVYEAAYRLGGLKGLSSLEDHLEKSVLGIVQCDV